MRLNQKFTVPATILTLALWVHPVPGLSETAKTPPPEKPIVVETTESTSLEKYGVILREERQALERQADRHVSSMEKLYDRGLYVIGAVLAIAVAVGTFAMVLFSWKFGKSEKELRNEIKSMMKGYAKESVDQEAEELKKRLRSIKDEVDDLNAYKSRKVVWVTYQDSRQVKPIIRVLHAFGITNINHLEVGSPDEITIDSPDLVILSFDKTDKGRSFLRGLVTRIRHARPPIPLLIFTYNYGGQEIRLGTEDFEILKGFDWYLPANVPATLISQTTALLRRTL